MILGSQDESYFTIDSLESLSNDRTEILTVIFHYSVVAFVFVTA
jgi:hypothetical protein